MSSFTRMRAALMVSAVAVSTSLIASQAYSGGFAIREQSTQFQGMSFAGSAAGGSSPSSMFWNPATVTQHNGITTESNMALILPRSTIDVDAATTPALGTTLPPLPILPADDSDIGHPALVPASYTAVQLNDHIYFGLGISSPFGLANEADSDYAGRFHGIEGNLLTINFNPVVGFRFNDYFSAAVGVQAMYGQAKLTQQTRTATLIGPAAVPIDAISELEGDGWGFGLTAGITVMPTPNTTIGLGYRSQVDLDLEGDTALKSVTPLVAAPVARRFAVVDIKATADLPDIVTLSLTHKFTERFKAAATVEWTNWSRFKELKVTADGNSNALALPIVDGQTLQLVEQEFDDGWFFAIGGEFYATDRVILRGGAAYEISPVTDSHRTPRIPDADRIWLSAGATYKHNERLSFDVAYTHIFVDDGDINLANYNQASNAGTGDRALLRATAEDQSVDIISGAVRYKFSGQPILMRR